MPEYISADALLADARLRTEAFHDELAVLVVEGHDDKRLFYGRVEKPAQIIAAGGRTLLLSAYTNSSAYDLDRMIFFTDCDYAVRRGQLRGGPSLVITSGTTVESDILGLGVLAPVLTEVAPNAVNQSDISRTCERIMTEAISIALPIGRLRMATQSYGLELPYGELDLSKYWSRKSQSFNDTKLTKVISDKLKAAGLGHDLARRLAETPDDPGMCNGKDLVRAIKFILHSTYNVGNDITDAVLSKMFRLSVRDEAFEAWRAVVRIRKWEERTGKRVLASRSAVSARS